MMNLVCRESKALAQEAVSKKGYVQTVIKIRVLPFMEETRRRFGRDRGSMRSQEVANAHVLQ